MALDYPRILAEIAEEVRPLVGQGRAAQYIPPLAEVPRDRFGMVLQTVGNEAYSVGHARERFSIQSIAKVFSLTLATKLEGDAVWERVSREPSGTAFNSLVQLEVERGIPRNPFLNAGALVVLDETGGLIGLMRDSLVRRRMGGNNTALPSSAVNLTWAKLPSGVGSPSTSPRATVSGALACH